MMTVMLFGLSLGGLAGGLLKKGISRLRGRGRRRRRSAPSRGRALAAGAAGGIAIPRLAGRSRQRPRGSRTRASATSLASRQAGGRMVPAGHRALGGAEDRHGRPLMVSANQATRIQCPPGYVAVMTPSGQQVCMLKGAAKSAGLYKERRKPPISAGDWRKLQVAERVRKKAKKIASKAGFTTTKKGSQRRGGSRRTRT